MTVKKYPQSHLVITKDAKKILIDPGYITFERGFKAEEFNDVAAILITHQHSDHLDKKHIKDLARIPIYGNSDVVSVLKELGIEAIIVKDRQTFSVAGFQITPIDLPHCKLQDGSDGPPNTGYLIDGILFHPGDGIELTGVTSPNVALPIAGPSITYDNALLLAQNLGAKLVIPIHYDSRFPADPAQFAQKAQPLGIEVRPLSPGEETTI